MGRVLTGLARSAVETSFASKPPEAGDLIGHVTPESMAEALARPAATFVTLEGDSKLRGCIGTLIPLRPLGVDVVRNARLATRDPRMPPVEPSEVPGLQVTVSVLSPASALAVDSFAALIGRLIPGTDGLTLHGARRRRATFLPTVWRSLPEPERFVAALLRKGGWPRDLWSTDLRSAPWPPDLMAERYTTELFTA